MENVEARDRPSRRTFLVSRHAAAKRWLLGEAARRGWRPVVASTHCRPEDIDPGDRVAGTVPIQLAAAICARGAEYWHLEVAVDEGDRGRELGFDELIGRGATLRRYHVAPWRDQ